MTRVETEERNCVHVSTVTGSEGGAGCDCIRIALPFGREVHMWKNWIIFDRRNFLQIVLLKRLFCLIVYKTACICGLGAVENEFE